MVLIIFILMLRVDLDSKIISISIELGLNSKDRLPRLQPHAKIKYTLNGKNDSFIIHIRLKLTCDLIQTCEIRHKILETILQYSDFHQRQA